MNSQRKKTRCLSRESQRQPRHGRRLVGELLEPRYLLTSSPHLLADIAAGATGSEPGDFVPVGDKTYFTVNGSEIWKTDGTTAGTVLVKDVAEGSDYSYWFYVDLHNHNGTLVAATYPDFALWRSDGTTDGTHVVKDFGENYGVSMSISVEFTSVDDTLFFKLDDYTANTIALWKTDLTEQGTVPVSTAPEYLWDLTKAGDTLFFTAYDEEHGCELWKSDGTESGTTIVRDIYPGTSESYGEPYANSSYPMCKEERDGVLYFFGTDEEHGRELWRSDGTESGTVLVKDIFPGPDSSYGSALLANVGATLFLAVDDGEHGLELWKSDGTSAGTSMVKDIWPGASSSAPDGYYAYYNSLVGSLNGLVIFTADDGTHGRELWKSDGTPEGTTLILDIHPGAASSYAGASSDFVTVEGKVYFSADDGVQGFELWESDGTPSGTRLVADIFPGGDEGYPNGSYPWSLASSGGMLIFSADDGVHGTEPWVLWTASGIAMTPESGRLVAEDAPTAGFSLCLKSPPASEVTVTLSATDPNTDVVNPLVVVFGPANWQVPQTVSVGSTLSSGSRDFSIDAALQSDDPNYQQSVDPLLFVDLFPWHNPGNPLDTNQDAHISAIDALLVINYLNTPPEDRIAKVGRFLDVTSDQYVSPIDALRVINYLNRGDGEGEMVVPSAFTEGMAVAPPPVSVAWLAGTPLIDNSSAASPPSPPAAVPSLPLTAPLQTGAPSDAAPAYTGTGSNLVPPGAAADLASAFELSTTEYAGEYDDIEEWRELLKL